MKKEKKSISKLKNLRIITFSFIILDFILVIISPFLLNYGYSSFVRLLLFSVYTILIPITGILMIVTFAYSFKSANNEKRTKKQELVIKQNLGGRLGLLAIITIILFIYNFFKPLELEGIVMMFLLFFLAILVGPFFGRLVIKK